MNFCIFFTLFPYLIHICNGNNDVTTLKIGKTKDFNFTPKKD